MKTSVYFYVGGIEIAKAHYINCMWLIVTKWGMICNWEQHLRTNWLKRLLFFCHQQAYDLNLSFWEGLELKLCAILSQQKKSYVLY